MAADEAQNEPTMEEILASIRKIISEDDEPEQEAAVEESAGDDILELDMEAEMEAEPMMAEEPEPEPEIEFEEPVMEEPEPDFEDDDIVAVEEPDPMPEPAPRFVAPPVDDSDALLEDEVAGKAAGALGQLMGSMAIGNGATLESIVRELLRPMLKEWLNENLPGIVEAKVEEEVKRISRMAR